MSRVFISHSSVDNNEARALKQWAASRGWGDLFLDIDFDDGLKGGQKWQDELAAAISRSEFVIILLSPNWVNSTGYCLWEFLDARGKGKRIIPVLIAPTPSSNILSQVTAELQVVDLTTGVRHADFPFSNKGLELLGISLLDAGLTPNFFKWPHDDDKAPAPFRGLAAMDAVDAAMFFGRDAPLRAAMDDLHQLRDGRSARLFAIIGASGAGKSSFLRAGLLPRLEREPRYFVPLRVIRPQQAVLSGEDGFAASIESTFQRKNLPIASKEVKEAIEGGATRVKELLGRLARNTTITVPPTSQASPPQPPALVLPIDQCEELFGAIEKKESGQFLELLTELLKPDSSPVVIAAITIRANAYESLQNSELRAVNRKTFDLGPIPMGQYSEIIKKPIERAQKAGQNLSIDDELVVQLLQDVNKGDAKDPLPLLAFTLERLYLNMGSENRLTIEQYNKLGGIAGSIGDALKSVMEVKSGRNLPFIGGSNEEKLKATLIPALVRLDPQTRQPVKVVADYDSFDDYGKRVIDALIEPRLLLEDHNQTTKKKTVEFAHEAIIRHWKDLQKGLADENAKLTTLNAVQRDAVAWDSEGRPKARLQHIGKLYSAASNLTKKPYSAQMTGVDRDYLVACRRLNRLASRRRAATVLTGVFVIALVSLAVLNLDKLPSFSAVLSRPTDTSMAAKEERKFLGADSSFKDCADCPTMVVLPLSLGGANDASTNVISAAGWEIATARSKASSDEQITAIAIARFEIKMAEWTPCLTEAKLCTGGKGGDWSLPKKPIVNVSAEQAKKYVGWLNGKLEDLPSRAMGGVYRLPKKSEWERANRITNARVATTKECLPIASKNNQQPLTPADAGTIRSYVNHGLALIGLGSRRPTGATTAQAQDNQQPEKPCDWLPADVDSGNTLVEIVYLDGNVSEWVANDDPGATGYIAVGATSKPLQPTSDGKPERFDPDKGHEHIGFRVVRQVQLIRPNGSVASK